MRQRTIGEKISCTGVGLHGGTPVQLTMYPARANSGIVFVRTDWPDPVEIPARPGAVKTTRFATTLGNGDATVATVEHLLAALYGLGIDNVRIGVDGPELPVLDGSAASFVFMIRSAGIYTQREPRSVLRLRRPLEVRNGERWIRIDPAKRLRISYAVEFEHRAIGRQEFEVDAFDPGWFERELSRARTFGFLHEVDALWRAGFARGASLHNTVVLGENGVLNPDGLRWSDEFVRHKVLDLFGDLALLGLPIQGHIRVERGGHAIHLSLLSAILENPDAWRICDADGRSGAAPELVPFPSPA